MKLSDQIQAKTSDIHIEYPLSKHKEMCSNDGRWRIMYMYKIWQNTSNFQLMRC